MYHESMCMRSWRELAKGRQTPYHPVAGGGARPGRGADKCLFWRVGTRRDTGCHGGVPDPGEIHYGLRQRREEEVQKYPGVGSGLTRGCS